MTIFALSSGYGKAGVAVLRVSGPRAARAAQAIAGRLPLPRRASLRKLRDPATGEILDRGIVVWFPGPSSFTGEDMAEFHVHGGRAVIQGMLAALGGIEGLRLAEPGAFTRRAFDNGRLDLTEAEGLADLIDAETAAQRRQAVWQGGGGLRVLYDAWRAELIAAMALVEARLDFADEEDVPEDVSHGARQGIERLRDAIARRLEDGRSGEILREGLTVVIAGPPNAGKSSLLNALARRDVAIVSEEAGTTRDVIEVRLDLGGYPVILMDTAGVREAPGVVEREGVRRALARAGDADLVLWLLDCSAGGGGPLPSEASSFWSRTLLVESKADLLGGVDADARTDGRMTPSHAGLGAPLRISAKTGFGLPALVERLAEEAAARMEREEPAIVTRARHRELLTVCCRHLDTCLAGDPGELELRAEDLRQAATALGRITGQVNVEEVLDQIFSGFCIGK